MGARRSTLTAAAIGAGLAGLAGAGATTQRRAVRRIERRPDPHAAEPFGTVRGRPVPVRASDGTRLYAEVDGIETADLAVVFSHGWTLSQDSWHFQRRALRGLAGLVFWDQRGHGRSGDGHRTANGIDQLGSDLAAVIEQTVPEGVPVVLVGHSMGGMTMMRYADQNPGAFGRRIVAAGLVCTSSGALGQVTLGLPAALARLSERIMPRAIRAASVAAPALEHVRRFARRGGLVIEDRIAFGPDASPAALAFSVQMLADTRMTALVDLYGAMTGTPTIGTCRALNEVDTLVIAAENDLLTPVGHSRTIASLVPSARLEIVPVSGHMVMLERPDVVSDRLVDLVERARKRIASGDRRD